MKKIKALIVTYYWPPSGGAGVQRWLKLTKYLSENDIECFVLTVDEAHASYTQTDHSLVQDVAGAIKVFKTKSFEPIKVYSRLFGKSKVPTAGFSNVDNSKWTQKLVNALRSNLFIPDPRKGWNRYAIRKAREIIKNEAIDLVITSSPPHSTQLIGLHLKRKLNIHWMADMRDPWTDVYHYSVLGHTAISRRIDRALEKQVLLNADAIVTVSEPIKMLFADKDHQINPDKIHVIPNGYDPEDFKDLKKKKHQSFTICYTGTMSEVYEPAVFLDALSEFQKKNDKVFFKIQVVGSVADAIQHQMTESGIDAEFIATVPHNEVVQYQKDADLLLLVIPNTEKSEGILTGKIFEYLATGNQIICIGPKNGSAAKIIKECQAGQTFERNESSGLLKYLDQIVNDYLNQVERSNDMKEVQKYSRKQQAKRIKMIAKSILESEENT